MKQPIRLIAALGLPLYFSAVSMGQTTPYVCTTPANVDPAGVVVFPGPFTCTPVQPLTVVPESARRRRKPVPEPQPTKRKRTSTKRPRNRRVA